MSKFKKVMTVKEQIEILQAYERGEEIEMRANSKSEWITIKSKDDGFIYQFNFSDKNYRIKKNWWRAKKGEEFYWLNYHGEVIRGNEHFIESDDECYYSGNYFRTEEIAEKAKCIIKGVLIKFHEAND